MDANLEGKETENLGSHCDWSIFTIVPVSEVAGLQIFNGEAWVSPEIVARRHAERDGVNMSDSTSCWNTKYAVVMAGKWLELLTNGRVPSTIHRVVSPRGSPRRFSVPFFLRLRPEVLETVEEQLVLEAPTDIKASTLAMSQFLIRKF
jgi:isopenicillin N synthase-like dioxygenase